MLETNIIVIHDQTPQISLPRSSFLRSRCYHSRRHDVCLATPTSPLLFLLPSRKSFYQNVERFVFRQRRKNGVFDILIDDIMNTPTF
jgi:hypothetical protein